jgi:general secretion pathway protein L
MMRDAILIFLPPDAGELPVGMRIVDGVLHPDGTSLAEGGGTHILILPAGMTASQRYHLPALPERQALGVARRRALDAAIGGEDAVHAVAFAAQGRDNIYDVVTIARAHLARAIGWAQALGIDPDVVLPIGLLLPDPAEGFVAGTIAGQYVVRGEGMLLPGDEAFVAAVIGDTSPIKLDDATLQSASVGAAFDLPCNLRTGEFAKRLRQPLDRAQILRIALWAACILLLALLITTARIVKLHHDTERLDAASLDIARPFVPDAQDAASAQTALTVRLGQTGGTRGGLTAPLASIVRAIQSRPGVVMTSLERDADGQMRIALIAPNADAIDDMVQKLREAGYGAKITVSAGENGSPSSILTVTP